MKRQPKIVLIALMLALTQIGSSKADVITPGRAVGVVETNDNLLISSKHSIDSTERIFKSKETPETFEAQMARDGWDVSNATSKSFYNVKKIISRQELLRAEDEINSKYFSARRQSNAVDRSA